jgi:GH15 family glucan-1,4-alpha-glucosidase
MARSIVLSNGELCIALDRFAEVRDVYFPHVGYEDHARGHYIHHLGVWVDGRTSWFDEDSSWSIRIACEEDSLASIITASNARLGIELIFKDLVYHEQPIFFRRVKITNLGRAGREIKLYFGHQFEIYKSHGGDTGYYDPASHSIIHYKGRRVFQIRAELDGELFSDYAIGISNFRGQEGAYRDADDGALSKNPIEHGPVDSVIGLYGTYAQGESKICHYWMAAAFSIAQAQELNEYVTRKSPEVLMQAAEAYWRSWGKKLWPVFAGLEPAHEALYKRSLMHARANVDAEGGIIASLDSDMLQYGLDTYSYVWPRDAAYVAHALDLAGEHAIAKRFFGFCASVITHDGYVMHKYLPDASLGSSWHPWIRGGELQLPIQEDETALIVFAFREHYRLTNDDELLAALYAPLIEKAANFMVQYRDKKTNLPDASYDLWEEKRGMSTFTCSTVYGALVAAAELSNVVGNIENEQRYRQAADEIRGAILTHLWSEKDGFFVRMMRTDGSMDGTLDVSSAYGVFSFGVLPPEDPRLVRAWEVTAHRLSQGIESGGLARYEGDQYYRGAPGPAGNPWILTTLWYAEYLMARAGNDVDMQRVREIFSWVVKHAESSGVLPEQLDPRTGTGLSATPLTWSHAAYITAVLKYLKRCKELGLPAVQPTK